MQKYSSLIDREINRRDDELEAAIADNQVPSESLNKEFFYIVAFIASFLLISLILLANALSPDALRSVSSVLEKVPFLDLKVSEQIISELRFPNPITSSVFVANLVFFAYVLFDSFKGDKDNTALVKLRRDDGSFYYTYRNTKAHFTESSSLSFAIHCAILFLILLSLMVSWQGKPKVKVTSIEFIPTQIVSKKPPPKNVKRKAAKQSIDQGKHNPKKKVAPSKPKSKPKPATKPATPKPKLKSKPRSPRPKPKAKPAPAPKAAKPKAAVKPKAAPRPSPKPSPKPRVSNLGSTKTSSPLSNTSSLPKLMNYSSGGATSTSGGTGTSAIPAPKSGGGSKSGSEIISQLGSIPRAPDSLGSGPYGSSQGQQGNSAPNPYGNRAPSIAAQEDVNFGPYMSALQRKIKRAWRPPRGSESNRIVVTFVVLRDGRLTNLKITQASPDPQANTAALKAVSAAAPFDPLPAGSADNVDIEFTFDYNVFQKQRY